MNLNPISAEGTEKPSATYIAPRAPSLKLKIRGKMRQFEQAQLMLTDERDIVAMDKILETMPNVSSLVQKVDKDQAAAFVREMVARQARTQGFVKGGLDGANAQANRNAQLLHERDVVLRTQGVDATSLALQGEVIRQNDVMLTEETANAQVSTTAISPERQAAFDALQELPQGALQIG